MSERLFRLDDELLLFTEDDLKEIDADCPFEPDDEITEIRVVDVQSFQPARDEYGVLIIPEAK